MRAAVRRKTIWHRRPLAYGQPSFCSFLSDNDCRKYKYFCQQNRLLRALTTNLGLLSCLFEHLRVPIRAWFWLNRRHAVSRSRLKQLHRLYGLNSSLTWFWTPCCIAWWFLSFSWTTCRRRLWDRHTANCWETSQSGSGRNHRQASGHPTPYKGISEWFDENLLLLIVWCLRESPWSN